MKFIVEVIDRHVERLEAQDDTVFLRRLHQIVMKELQGYSSDVTRASVRVIELAPNQEVVTRGFSA